jgi:hypothetical protein
MLTRQSFVTALGAIVLGSVLGATAYGNADASLHTNYLTFSGAVSLPGVTLPAGTYIFEQADFNLPNVVVVRDRHRSKLFYLGFTQRVDRPNGMRPDALVTFAETARGVAPRIEAWYPEFQPRGYAFRYPR